MKRDAVLTTSKFRVGAERENHRRDRAAEARGRSGELLWETIYITPMITTIISGIIDIKYYCLPYILRELLPCKAAAEPAPYPPDLVP